jgi:hypothetical protein
MPPKLKQLLEQRPFRPFALETVGGTRISVKRPDWFFSPPGTDDFVVFHSYGPRGGGYWICAYSDLTENIEVLAE